MPRSPSSEPFTIRPVETMPVLGGTGRALIEVVMIGGRVLRAPASLPCAELRRLIRAVESA